MKIACVAYLPGRGGAERQIIMLANELARLGNDVTLIVLAVCNIVYDVSSDVKVVDLSKEWGMGPLKILVRFFKLYFYLSKEKFDVSIHFWLQSAYFVALMLKCVVGRFIFSERSDPKAKEYTGSLTLLRKFALHRADGLVFQTIGAQLCHNSNLVAKSRVIHNSLFIPEGLFESPCTKREKKIISVGRLHSQKNQRILIEAFAKVSKQYPDYVLEIYGDGPLKNDLECLINECGLKNRAFLKPSCSNIFEIMYTASLFVLTSDFEGLPNALMEALALGVPCISTDCRPGGARELIENDVNGWIVPVGDSGALVVKMCSVLKEKSLNEMCMNNICRIRSLYSVGSVYSCWNDYIKTVCVK